MKIPKYAKLFHFLIFRLFDCKNTPDLVNHYRRSISSIVSGAILLSSFTVIGTMAVYWSQNIVALHEQSLGLQYANATNKIRESLALENFWYDTPHQKLNVSLKNTAQIGMTIIQIQVQGSNSQAYLLTPFQILPGADYTSSIKYAWMGDPLDIFVTTARGSIFRFHLTAPTDGILIIQKVSILGNGNFSFNGDLGKFNVTTAGYTPGAGLDKNGNLVLTGTIRDVNGTGYPCGNPSCGHLDFEKPCPCFFGVYTGILLPTLGADSKPVYNNSTTSPFNHGPVWFKSWYHDVPGNNTKATLSITLPRNNGTSPPTWSYINDSFFPIDNQLWGSDGNDGNGNPHNFSFTYEVHNSFTYLGGETFNFFGDDDVWLFINHKLVVDIGGVHSKSPGSVNLDSLGLTKGNSYPFDFFYAERHTVSSDMEMTTSIQLSNNGVGSTPAFFVNPGKYNVNEIVPAGWHILNEQCTNGYTPVNSTEITITVPKGTTTCTFTNTH
jgi:fibro-slime domain-containing protein